MERFKVKDEYSYYRRNICCICKNRETHEDGLVCIPSDHGELKICNSCNDAIYRDSNRWPRYSFWVYRSWLKKDKHTCAKRLCDATASSYFCSAHKFPNYGDDDIEGFAKYVLDYDLTNHCLRCGFPVSDSSSTFCKACCVLWINDTNTYDMATFLAYTLTQKTTCVKYGCEEKTEDDKYLCVKHRADYYTYITNGDVKQRLAWFFKIDKTQTKQPAIKSSQIKLEKEDNKMSSKVIDSVVTVAKQEYSLLAPRVLAKQSVARIRQAVVAGYTSKFKGKEKTKREQIISEFLQSQEGEAILSIGMSIALPTISKYTKIDSIAGIPVNVLVTEYRIAGEAHFVDKAFTFLGDAVLMMGKGVVEAIRETAKDLADNPMMGVLSSTSSESVTFADKKVEEPVNK